MVVMRYCTSFCQHVRAVAVRVCQCISSLLGCKESIKFTFQSQEIRLQTESAAAALELELADGLIMWSKFDETISSQDFMHGENAQ
jgi:hypothetical protein